MMENLQKVMTTTYQTKQILTAVLLIAERNPERSVLGIEGHL